jgi:hypothetical protein
MHHSDPLCFCSPVFSVARLCLCSNDLTKDVSTCHLSDTVQAAAGTRGIDRLRVRAAAAGAESPPRRLPPPPRRPQKGARVYCQTFSHTHGRGRKTFPITITVCRLKHERQQKHAPLSEWPYLYPRHAFFVAPLPLNQIGARFLLALHTHPVTDALPPSHFCPVSGSTAHAATRDAPPSSDATDSNQVGAARRAMTATFGRKRFCLAAKTPWTLFTAFMYNAGRKSPGSEAESASLSRQGPGARAGVGVTPALTPPGQLATATVIVRRRPNPLSGRQPNGAYSRADASTHALLFFFSLRGGFFPRVCAALFSAALPPPRRSQVRRRLSRPSKAQGARCSSAPPPPKLFQGNRRCAPFNPARAAFCVCACVWGIYKGEGRKAPDLGAVVQSCVECHTDNSLITDLGGGGWAFC